MRAKMSLKLIFLLLYIFSPVAIQHMNNFAEFVKVGLKLDIVLKIYSFMYYLI